MITVVDYGRGNLFSLSNALTSIGAAHVVTSDPQEVASAEMLILPGVGAFGDAIETLRSRGLDAPIIERIAANVPFLGICVGCQLLLGWGREFGRRRAPL